MTIDQIEAELQHLTSDELKRLAFKSWGQFVQREGASQEDFCDEDDPNLLAALDAAILESDSGSSAVSADEVQRRLRQWITK